MLDNKSLIKAPQAALNTSLRGLAYLNKQDKPFTKTRVLKSFKSSGIKEEMTIQEIKDLYVALNALENKVDLRKSTVFQTPDLDTSLYFAYGGSPALAWCRSTLKKQGILKSYSKDITESEINTEGSSRWEKQPVIKAIDTELMQVTYVVMQEGIDAHGDYTSLETIRSAKESFNSNMVKANLFHLVETDTFSIIESYLAPVDMVLGEHFVRKGTWLATLQIHDPELWQMIKDGDIVGVSIGAVANVEVLDQGD